MTALLWKYIQPILIICRFAVWECSFCLKCICKIKINTHSAYMVIGGHVHLPPTRWLSAFSYQLFVVFLMLYCLHLCAFCWWFYCLKITPSVVLKCCLAFLSTRWMWCALWRKYINSPFFRPALVKHVLHAIGHEFDVMNQQYKVGCL